MHVWRRSSVFFLVAAAVIVGSRSGLAQCQSWQAGHSAMGTSGAVFASCVFDDGSGPALYAGGQFTSVGADPINDIAKWDGSRWSPLGLGTNGVVRAVAVFDDGSGPALYVGGEFTDIEGMNVNHIARWDGMRWSTVGVGANNNVETLYAFNDGSGPALYAGGAFNNIGGVNANYIAKWNGSAWSALGVGVDGAVFSLTEFQSTLIVGGLFQNAGGAAASYVAEWNGTAWSALGSGTNNFVVALSTFDDGTGQALYAGGFFTSAGGNAANRVAKWNGSAWSALGAGFNNIVHSLTTYDFGSGTALYAGGEFVSATGSGVSKWNGANWTPLAGGTTNGGVFALTGFNDGNGPALFVEGSFLSAKNTLEVNSLTSRSIVKWDGANWAGVGGGTDSGPSFVGVSALTVFDDGTGAALYLGGPFQSAGSVSAFHIAKYKGGHFSALGSGLSGGTFPSATALTAFDDGSGPALYVGGAFTNAGGVSVNKFAKWNGSSWSAVSNTAVGGTFNGGGEMTVYDIGSGPALYAHGVFTPTVGSPANYIARWDGSVWTPIGDANSVNVLIGFNDGTGPALFVAGSFSNIGGVAANWIAKWNGSVWSALGGGTDSGSGVNGLTVFDDGSGAALYACGGFGTFHSVVAPARIVKWNGAWSAVGSAAMDPSSQVITLQVLDDGSGSGAALYAAGVFYHIGGVSMSSIAQWNGSTWSPLGAGINGDVDTLAVFDDHSGGGPDLWAGGEIETAGAYGSGNFAQWQGCGRPGVPMCFGDGTAAACPCANNGMPAHGCNNSAATGGARLTSSGWTSVAYDSLKLTSSGELASAFSVFLQGTAEISPTFFGDGLRCAGGNLKRLYTKPASGGVVFAPHTGDPSISARSALLGNTIFAGTTRVYQVYYRDPSLTFCPSPTGNTWNVSSGLRITWLP